MEKSLTPIKTERVLSSLYLDKVKSLKDGTRDSPAWLKGKKPLLFVLLIMLMELKVHLPKFHQTQLWISMLSCLISKTRRKKNGSTVMSRSWVRPKNSNRVEMTSWSKVIILEQHLNTRKEWNSLNLNILLKQSNFSIFSDWIFLRLTSNWINSIMLLRIVEKSSNKKMIVWRLSIEEELHTTNFNNLTKLR